MWREVGVCRGVEVDVEGCGGGCGGCEGVEGVGVHKAFQTPPAQHESINRTHLHIRWNPRELCRSGPRKFLLLLTRGNQNFPLFQFTFWEHDLFVIDPCHQKCKMLIKNI